MRRIKIALMALLMVVPSMAYIYQAHAATLLVTVDPNTYSGSGDVTDTTSNLTGTMSNVTYSSSTNCGVFTFNGSNSTITFPSTNFGTQFSISAWVKPNSGSSIQTLFSNAGTMTYTNGFKVYWNTWSTSDLKMLVEDGDGSTGAATVSTSAVMTNNAWQHIVFTINKSTGAIAMYRNGSLVSNDGTAFVTGANFNQTWWLGSIAGGSYWMNAQLGVVKIYSTVLTQAEVTSDYNSTSARYGATPSCPLPAAPTNSSVPTISGTVAYNSVLTAANGTWTGSPTGYTYQWQSATTSGGTYSNISGATSSTYTLTSADIGNYIKVQVTATNAGGSNSALSVATAQVAKATQATLSFTSNSTAASYPYSASLTLTPSGGTGTGAITYAIASGGTATSCALSNSSSTPTITASTSGTCFIQATKAADTNYLAATSANVTFTFSKATPGTLTITTTSGSFGTNLTLLTSGGQSSASDTFSVTSGPCTVSGAVLTPTSNGICNVTAYRAADTNYLAVNSASTAITIAKGTPTATYSLSAAPVFRKSTTITFVASAAGTVKFQANGKSIPGCLTKAANAGNSYTVTCLWKPALHGPIKLAAQFTPTNSSYNNTKIDGPSYYVPVRSNTR